MHMQQPLKIKKKKSFTVLYISPYFCHLLYDGSSVLMDLVLNRDLNIKKAMFDY